MLALVILAQAPKVDPVAMALLRRNRDVMLALRGYRAECRTTEKWLDSNSGAPSREYRFAVLTAAKPNLMRYDMWTRRDSPIAARPKTLPNFTEVSNGKQKWSQFSRMYVIEDASPKTLRTHEPWEGFYDPEESLYERTRRDQRKGIDLLLRRMGSEKIGDVPCDKIQIVTKENLYGESFVTHRLVFLRPDGLLRRQVLETLNKVNTADITGIEKNPDLRRQVYAYTPPIGITLWTPPR